MNQTLNSGIPGDYGWPIIGDIPSFFLDFEKLLRDKAEKHGPVFRWNPIKRGVCLLGAEATEFVLRDPKGIFEAGPGWVDRIGSVFRNGILVKDGLPHRHLRRLMQPAFRKGAIDGYVMAANPIIDRSLDHWQGASASSVDIYELCKTLTLKIALKTFFGVEAEQEDFAGYNRAITDLVDGSIALIKLRIPGLTHNRACRSRKWLEEHLIPLVHQRRSVESDDMLGQLAIHRDEDGQMLKDEEIVDQMIFMMMAAHDTTASTLTSLHYELAKNTEWQDKLYESGKGIEETTASASELSYKLPLHLACVKETLRLHTPLKGIPRVPSEDFEFAGYKIAKGTLVSVCPAYNHRMSEYWPEPGAFQPQRFAKENLSDITPYSYGPFGHGAHACLGQMFAERFVTLIIHKVIQRYRWELTAFEGFVQIPIQKPRGTLKILLQRRASV